jgi:hypothetical protein
MKWAVTGNTINKVEKKIAFHFFFLLLKLLFTDGVLINGWSTHKRAECANIETSQFHKNKQ